MKEGMADKKDSCRRQFLPGEVPIGTMIWGNQDPAGTIRSLAPAGFECFTVMFWETLGGWDPAALAAECRAAAEETGTFISCLSIFGNVLRGDEKAAETRRGLELLIDAAGDFGCSLVSGFAGRVPGRSVPESIDPWREVFDPLADKAEKKNVRIAFENCRMGDTWKTGKWNIAINPDAWELMFRALPSGRIGLEWEPCHQVEALCDPGPQLAQWLPRIFHLHGKDSRTDKDLLSRKGLYGSVRWYASCFPGNGDTDWKEILEILAAGDYPGTVDVEGWNDAQWAGDRELEGQKRALDYLKSCRRGLTH